MENKGYVRLMQTYKTIDLFLIYGFMVLAKMMLNILLML